MNIAIVGAGAAGIATAHALACDGHAVTVYDRHGSAAEGASFAPTGWLAPALLQPWSAPGLRAPASLLRIGSGLRRAELSWLWQWRQAGRRIRSAPEQAHPALAAIERLSRYSRQLRDGDPVALDQDLQAQNGAMVLLRSEATLARLAPALKVLADAGVPVQRLDAAQARLLEPGLAGDFPLAAALNLPEAATANSRLWVQLQRFSAQQMGVQFVFNAQVTRLQHAPARVQLADEAAPRKHEAIVVCTGMEGAALLRPLGLHLPLIGLGGYTASAPVREPVHAPRCALLDWDSQITLVRLGQRVRAGGGAELGTSGTLHKPSLQRLFRALNQWFPGGMHASQGLQGWRGTRAMTPDGAPLLGASGLPGIWLNLGHGTHGAAMAHGCAWVLADLVKGRAPAIDTAGLTLERF
ncbi:FAD-dependent oxidoreductase [Comamonas endophytica]|uniref:FAD-dependent oxidoreductase n=1 Tax=Comamonas endophytica TaxID=2949090 RepID=A0ABY6GAV9_9BURK|nr:MULTISPECIES: FAD-dependent oxidoreductase [unclassified Acidovorax]MCD2513798.1 FAD-dependent oxidoreductase [Acidovorax sp. D4N7]UYG52199.1 FAD-dependent oxidoreductase [Acidovorax sp. 5MLIR]